MNLSTGLLQHLIYGWSKDEAQAAGRCIACRGRVDVARLDEVDAREYGISGLCPECFEYITFPWDEGEDEKGGAE